MRCDIVSNYNWVHLVSIVSYDALYINTRREKKGKAEQLTIDDK